MLTGHIPDSFIEELLSRVDIVDVIGGYIPLKRLGANFVARCPFHTEKSPSFTVSQAKQFYHCFGCGAHGSVLRFLMEFEGIHFVEACEKMASKLGLTLPIDHEKDQPPPNTPIYEILSEASSFFQKQLRIPTNRRAVDYLKSRGLTGQTAKTFEIGYAPQGWDNVFKELGKGKDKKVIDQLVSAGLVICKQGENKQGENKQGENEQKNNQKNKQDENNQSENKQKNNQGEKYFDRFRDRIMFPIRDRRGRVLGFGGRILNQGSPKYLNSPETPVFNKGQEVYGLYEARLKDRHMSSLIVVEGYIDVICLSQFGIENVVATLGTAVTEKHLELLFRQVSELYFCFDGDKAGRTAAKRALWSSLPHMKEGRRVKFVFLPNGEDPDSFVRKQGKAGFLNLLQHATSLSDYLFDEVSSTLDLRSIDGRAELVNKAKPLIARLPKGVLQQMMFERLSELSGLPDGSWKKAQKAQSKPFAPFIRDKNRVSPPSSALRAVAMLLDHRHLLSLISNPHVFHEVDIPGTALLCAIIGLLQNEPHLSVEMLKERMSEESRHYLESLDLQAISRFNPGEGVEKEGIEAEFIGAMARLKERANEQALEDLLRKSKENVLTSEEKIKLRYLVEQQEKIE